MAMALILSYVENLISFQPGIPGIKIGLANLAVILCLYLFGAKEAFDADESYGQWFFIWQLVYGHLFSGRRCSQCGGNDLIKKK